jgi:hypothetical protein
VDTQHVIDAILAAFVGVIGWVLRTLHGEHRELANDLTQHKVEVAKNYATNADLSRIEDKLDRILDKLDLKADK